MPKDDQVRRTEFGFSLVELLVIVLIIGILLVIAIPAFLSAQRSSRGRVATVNVREALSAGRVVYADLGTFDTATFDPALRAAEPSLGWTALGSSGPEEVSWASLSSTEVRYAVKSKAGDCYLIRDNLSSGAGSGTTYAKNVNAATCEAGDPASYQPSSVAAVW